MTSLTAPAVALLGAIPPPPSDSFGPFRLYGLMIALGVLAAVLVAQRRWRAWGGDPDDIMTVAVWAVPAGLVGARLYHVITDWNRLYADDPWRAVEIWNGGLGIPGGVLAGAVVGIVVARRIVPSWRRLADAVAPGIPLAQAIGRLGNYFNQELYGRPSDLPWALEVDLAYRPTDPEYAGVSTYHPTFLYEGLWNLGLFGLIVWGGTKVVLRPGRWFAVYVTGYGLGRLWVEALRIDTASLVFGVRVNIWMALVIAAGGLVWLFWGGSPVDREATQRLRAGVEPWEIFAAETALPAEGSDEEPGTGAEAAEAEAAEDEAAEDEDADATTDAESAAEGTAAEGTAAEGTAAEGTADEGTADEGTADGDDDAGHDDAAGGDGPDEPMGSAEGGAGGGSDAVGERGPGPD